MNRKNVYPAKGGVKTKYFEGLGRRKESVARVRIYQERKQSSRSQNLEFLINERISDSYFPLLEHQETIFAALKAVNFLGNKVTVKVKGGGKTGQAEAIRLGIARALVKMDNSLKPKLKKLGFLTRDSRVVERKKYGLKKARRAPQWQKR